MSKALPKSPPPTEPTEIPAPLEKLENHAPVDPEAEARSRAIACHEEIGRVLDRMRCRLVPMIADPEPVGSSGDRIQIRATYAIVPKL